VSVSVLGALLTHGRRDEAFSPDQSLQSFDSIQVKHSLKSHPTRTGSSQGLSL
jgi:hypothetical protein